MADGGAGATRRAAAAVASRGSWEEPLAEGSEQPYAVEHIAGERGTDVARSTTRAEPPSNRRRISRRMKAAVGSRRRPRSADHFISHVRSEDGYRPSSRACASTTCATRPWPSPPGRTRRRSPTAWATRQSPSPWTATGTCSHRRRGAGRRPGRPAPARGPEGNVIPIGAAE